MSSEAMEVTKDSEDDSSSVTVLTPAETETEIKEEKNGKENTKNSQEKSDKKGNEGSDSEEKGEKVMVGLVADSVDLYAKYDKNGNRTWSDIAPDDLEEAAEGEKTEKYCVIIRKKKPKEADSIKPLVIDSLIIQSPYLKRVLGKVFDGYPGVITDVSRLKLHAPFEEFIHRWDQFTAAKDDTSYDQITRDHVQVLYKIMEDELGELIQLRQDYFKNRAVAFEHVWTLFPPGCSVCGSKNGKPVCVRFDSGYYAKTQCGNVYVLQCKVIDFDGKIMGFTDLNQQIGEFSGTVPFSELPCYPLEYHPRPDMARAALLERGRKFEKLAGYCYKSYNGVAIWHVNDRKSRKENVQSRIVIDGENWEKLNPDHTVYLENIHGHTELILGDVYGNNSEKDSDKNDDNDDSSDEDGWKLTSKHSEIDNLSSRPPLTEEQLIMTYPMVRGYALKNKRWMEFFVDDVAEVQFNEQAFKSLVLPHDQKELILAFAQSQVKFKNVFDDVILGKGKGIIMLLSGPPGVGKTLSAESVAEEMKVPLYMMSAGDLGSDAYEVEENLTRILEMVANWDAVLLLDECDVFLEARSPNDINRNRLVSIFLRTLEYYEGILFLTTNRVKNMDAAFQSRIHLSLEYPNLEASAREAIWNGFLSRAVKLASSTSDEAAHEVTKGEVKQLAQLDLNGRQIKNVLKSSNLLACHKGEKLALKHLRTVLKVEGHSL